MKLRTAFQAALIAAASAGAAHAGETSAAVTFSNLSFQLVDLNAADGVQATYQTSGLRLLSDYAAPFDLGDGNYLGLYDGTADVDAGAQTQGYDLSAPTGRVQSSWDGNSMITRLASNSPDSFAFVSGQLVGLPFAEGNGFGVSLAANSLLIISVDVSLSTALAMPQGCQIGINPSSNLSCATAIQYADAAASLELEYSYADLNGEQSGYGSFRDGLYRQALIDASLVDANGAYTGQLEGFVMTPGDNVSRKLQVVFANTTIESQMGYVRLMSNLSVQGPRAYEWPESPVTPSIPEPGTWSLMALGGLGLAAAVRRRRQS